jgi:hypothetical protein
MVGGGESNFPIGDAFHRLQGAGGMGNPSFQGLNLKIPVSVLRLTLFRSNLVGAGAVEEVDRSYWYDETAGPFQDFRNYYFFQPGHGQEGAHRLPVVEAVVVVSAL